MASVSKRIKNNINETKFIRRATRDNIGKLLCGLASIRAISRQWAKPDKLTGRIFPPVQLRSQLSDDDLWQETGEA